MTGLELSRAFFHAAVRPIVDRVAPAGLRGGSIGSIDVFYEWNGKVRTPTLRGT